MCAAAALACALRGAARRLSLQPQMLTPWLDASSWPIMQGALSIAVDANDPATVAVIVMTCSLM